MRTLTLTPPVRSPSLTKILIGRGAGNAIPVEMKLGAYDRIACVYDKSVTSIARDLAGTLGECTMLPVESGDASKSLAEADRLAMLMLDAGCTKNSLLVCIGGGMMSDLGGFLASVFMRGIPCVLVPTSFLGMVDAAIGGKTAVNAGGRKNMIGSIAHPMCVAIDPVYLQGLAASQMAEGMVEVIKIAAMVDRPFFEWLESSVSRILGSDAALLEECIVRAVESKVRIVEQDDHDRDARLLLNFGHTVGHAVEALSRYELSHGAAVSIGMFAEMKALGSKDLERVSALLKTIGTPLSLPPSMSKNALWEVMLSDKKNEKGVVRCAVPVRIGEGAVQSLRSDRFLTLFS